MYLFKICLLSLVVIFVASKTLSGGGKKTVRCNRLWFYKRNKLEEQHILFFQKLFREEEVRKV